MNAFLIAAQNQAAVLVLVGLAALALGCVWVLTTAACRYAEAEYQALRRQSEHRANAFELVQAELRNWRRGNAFERAQAELLDRRRLNALISRRPS